LLLEHSLRDSPKFRNNIVLSSVSVHYAS